MRRTADFHSQGDREKPWFLKNAYIEGCYFTGCIGGCPRAAPTSPTSAILLLTRGQRGADGRGQTGPAPTSLQSPPPASPSSHSLSFVKAPSSLHPLQQFPKARAGVAIVAFEGYTSRIIFITIFIQCLSHRCTDPLQWRKKRTQNLFSKDIQIS